MEKQTRQQAREKVEIAGDQPQPVEIERVPATQRLAELRADMAAAGVSAHSNANLQSLLQELEAEAKQDFTRKWGV
jgi:hypothetical protein